MAWRREEIRPLLGTGPIRTVPSTKTYSSGTIRTVHPVDNNIRLFRLQLMSVFIPFSLRIVSYIAVGALTSLEGVCTGYTMLVDSQDAPVIRTKQPWSMDYVNISRVLIRPTVRRYLSLFAVMLTNSILDKFQDNPALGQQHNGSTVSSLVTLTIGASSQYLLMQKNRHRI
ncbi:hypothetical protein SeLEV6574_g02815 [Synchytrium endobioticum]|uniref:Uncharacterized protein n=1 Tax=Synchytrium endobioticum TaxID=286115 RepID=A0A507D794_9FUNG|nr:hypothetical protein SeLEV6574_g02815 [Synchytrium endobioticum]